MMHGHELVAREDRDLALDDDEERAVAVALVPEGLAVREAPLARERP